jgi:hypothetical protein
MALGYANAAEWIIGTLLNRGKAVNQSLATGASYTQDVNVGGWDDLSIAAIMTGAANGDLVVSVFPIFPDGTVGAVSITPLQSTGPTYAAPNVQYTGNYDVSGYQKVRISVKNNNAATQTLNNFSWQLS